MILLLLLLCPILRVSADTINKVDMKVDILDDGTANIEEVWNVKASSGSEWYKQMYNLGDMELTNFKVLMDGEELTYKSYWDVNGSMSEKAGYYGINYVSEGLELCFGKSDYKTHNFTLSYTLSNFVFNTDDSKVIEYLKVFTFLSKEDIEALEESVKKEPEKRLAQMALAYEVVKDIHGKEEADLAKKTSEEVFSKGYSEEGMEEVSVNLSENDNIMDVMVKASLVSSKSEARRLIEGNGISINSEKVNDPNKAIKYDDFENNSFVISKGKKIHIKINLVK